jgi:hypothetical protein
VVSFYSVLYGNQYASHEFRAVLKEHGIRASMSRKATAGTTAVSPVEFEEDWNTLMEAVA